jgi:hypothetical protein
LDLYEYVPPSEETLLTYKVFTHYTIAALCSVISQKAGNASVSQPSNHIVGWTIFMLDFASEHCLVTEYE